MKTSSEYRALAWKELGAHFGKSFLLVVIISLAIVVLLAIPTASVYALQDSDWMEAAIGIGIVFILCTLGALYYYLPAWFLSLKRTHTTADAHIPYPKALLAGWMMSFPWLLLAVTQVVGKIIGGSGELVAGLLVLGIYCFLFWWAYAVSLILPFIVQDNKELSLIQATRRSIALMEGHKMELLKVDIKLLLWPVLLLFAIGIGMAVTVAFAKTGGGAAAVWALAMTIGTVILMLVMFFAVFPAMQYAHVLFYEDLLAEQQPASSAE